MLQKGTLWSSSRYFEEIRFFSVFLPNPCCGAHLDISRKSVFSPFFLQILVVELQEFLRFFSVFSPFFLRFVFTKSSTFRQNLLVKPNFNMYFFVFTKPRVYFWPPQQILNPGVNRSFVEYTIVEVGRCLSTPPVPRMDTVRRRK